MNRRFKKGKKAEEIVKRACKELLSENKLVGFERRDGSGTDFLLFFNEQSPLKVEVKSSYNGEFFHNIKHNTKVLVVPIKNKKVSGRRVRKLIRMTKNKIVEMKEY